MASKAKEEIKTVHGQPAKDFFVNMLTRDIELHDALLDLLDNCVDGALRTRGPAKKSADSLSGFWAKITFNENRFVIEDNCGGIPWNIARDYAFKMGKPPSTAKPEGTIGVVGIGMKRAIFKLGRECFLHSNHKDDTFLVTISPQWFLNDSLWEFPAERERAHSKNFGTIIEISELTPAAKLAFRKDSNFRQTFPKIVGESYAYLIEKGFRVEVNNEPVRHEPVRLCFEYPDEPGQSSGRIRPYLYTAKVNGVDVFLAVGYRSGLKTEQELEDDKEVSFHARQAGWTIVCNDRVVLSHDRTVTTGWGVAGAPNFHNQFSCIAGIVEFRAAETALLPVTTTKRGIDAGKDIYTIIRPHMQAGLKQFTKNTNRWRGFETELRERFSKANYLDLRQLREIASKTKMTALRSERDEKQFSPRLPEKQALKTSTRISFLRSTKDVQRVSLHLFGEVRKGGDVGAECFDRILKEART
jgi:hypothetical protein